MSDISVADAINSLSSLKNTFQALEKLEAILKKVNGMENYLHELEVRKTGLETGVSAREDQLKDLDIKLAAREHHLETRTAEIAAELERHQSRVNEAKVSLDLDLEEHTSKHEAAFSQVSRDTNLKVTELNDQIVQKTAEYNSLSKKVEELKELARSITS